MEELYKILLSKTKNLSLLGFTVTRTSSPKGMSFSQSWRHEALNLNFSITWDRMEMIIVCANIGNQRVFQHFYKLLEEYQIDFELNKIAYGINPNDQFNKVRFNEVLEYNLNKLFEFVIRL